MNKEQKTKGKFMRLVTKNYWISAVVCHNCHAIFDSGAFYINDDLKSITWLHQPNGGGTPSHSSELFSKREHHGIDLRPVSPSPCCGSGGH